MVPGARVMTRSGLFVSLVEYDKDDLSKPAKVEIAPGVVVELHTQAVDLAPETAEAADAATDDDEVADADERVENETGAEQTLDSETAAQDKPGTYTVNGVETDELPGPDTTTDKRDDKNA